MTYLQARTANEVLKAQERKMRLQKLRGELVDRARATALVFRLARQERDAWAGWPARVAAMMAADLGIGAHAMQTVLETHVRQHLGELADLRAGVPVTELVDGGPQVELGFDGAEDLLRAWRDGLTPDPDLTVSAWADKHRVLSSRGA